MSLASTHLDYNSTSTPSPVTAKDLTSRRYGNCYYRQGKYCCSKVCTIVVLLLFTTLAGVTMAGLSLWFDNWAGISTNPYATLDLPYPSLGPEYLDYVKFNKTIPNDVNTLYKYIDNGGVEVRFIISRYGLLSHCKVPVRGPRISLFPTPWSSPTCQPTEDQIQCPIIAMRERNRGARPRIPTATTFGMKINGCIKKEQLCDGSIDCPTGHDEQNCVQPPVPCGPDMVQCSISKPVCISKLSVCDGLNDCGMHEDEQNCCGKDGYVRCRDGTCLSGAMCDSKADCIDASDEYNCPDPSSPYYTKCDDGQLIDASKKCEKKEHASFQCKDMSDETNCDYSPKPLHENPALKSLAYSPEEKCFKQSFTFHQLNQSMYNKIYPDNRLQSFMKEYEYSEVKIAIVISLGGVGLLCLIAIAMLLCFGKVNRRCQTMRRAFIVLSIIYLLCIVQALLSGIYWIRYVNALNAVMENPTSSNLYEQVEIETVQVTGGLATIRISAQLSFYNCGFFGLAMILSIIAAHILKHAACHTHGSISFTKEYREEYSDDHLVANGLLMTRGESCSTATDNGIGTPDQIVTPHRSVKSYDVGQHYLHSDSTMRVPPRYHSHHQIGHGTNAYHTYNSKANHGGSNDTNNYSNTYHPRNTYMSFKDVDSIDKLDRLSQPLMVTTLDRDHAKARTTQV